MAKAKDKQEEGAQAEKPAQTVEELQAQLEALQKKVQEGEEGALKRVCKAMGVDEGVIKAEEGKPQVQMVEYDLGHHEVHINGRGYTGRGTCSLDTLRVLQSAIGDKRMRHLREMTGSDWLIQQIGGGVSAKLIGQVNEYGEKIK